MTATRLARRTTTVSVAAVALCLLSAGTSFADTPVPPVPAPDNVVTTLDQTVTQLTGVDPTATPTTTPAPTTPATGSGQQRAVAAPKSTRQHARQPQVASATRAPSAAAGPRAPMSTGMSAALSLPPATGISVAAGAAPAVAPLLIPQVAQRVTPAAAILEADKHTGPPVRGILTILAIAAALGLGYEHLRLVRAGLPA